MLMFMCMPLGVDQEFLSFTARYSQKRLYRYNYLRITVKINLQTFVPDKLICDDVMLQ